MRLSPIWLLLATTTLVAGCSRSPAPSATDDPVPVQAVLVGETGAAPAPDTVFTAALHHDREATLAFRVAGTVRALPVRIGQRLGAGALVAALDPTPYAAGAARAQAEAGRTTRAAERFAALAPEGAVSPAQARDAADAQVAARAQLSAAAYDLAATRLAMPFSGVVLERRSEVGETVGAGQMVARVADLGSAMIATAAVPGAVAARLHRGQAARVEVAARATPLAARVLRIGGAADPHSDLVPVDLALSGAGDLPSGAVATAHFALPPAAPAASGEQLIPAEALLEAGGGTAHVYVIDGQGRARRRMVRFLGFADAAARVSGLNRGERVVTMGAGFISDGQPVQVVAP